MFNLLFWFICRLSLQDYLDKFDSPENRERLVNVRLWVQNTEYLNKISEVAERRRSRSGSQPLLKDDENMNLADPDPVDNLLIEDPRTEPEEDLSKRNVEKSKSSETLADCTTVETKLEPLDVTDTVEAYNIWLHIPVQHCLHPRCVQHWAATLQDKMHSISFIAAATDVVTG